MNALEHIEILRIFTVLGIKLYKLNRCQRK
jgi:hypothetical protein